MAKGQKKLQDQATQRSNEQYASGQQAQNDLRNSPEVAAWQARVKGMRDTINSGNYLNDKNFASNKSRLIDQKNQRESMLSLNPSGAGAMALSNANPNEVAQQRMIADDAFARDQTAQTEQDVRDFRANTDAQEGAIIDYKTGVNTNLMNTGYSNANQNWSNAFQVSQARAANNPWRQAMGAAIQGAVGMLAPMASGALSGSGGSAASGATRPRIVPGVTPSYR